jgi:acylphosphatase
LRRLNLKIYGRVQGVGFRYSAAEEAGKLGAALLAARNEPDGSVYIEAEGEENALQKFLAWCRRGPRSAKVERVEAEWRDAGN